MAGKIFINYRRGDDPGFTQALYQRLEDEFSAEDLFMDVEGHIKPGDDFVEVLHAQVAASDVLLAVIGPRWQELLATRDDDPDDFVQIEIRAALEMGIRVIPVLVGGAEIPKADLLPEPIRRLARRNAVGLRPERFKADCQGLIASLKEQLAAAIAERAARTEAERKAAEEARHKREAEEMARAAAAEQRAREQALADLSPEEIRKAEELANWQFVAGRDDIAELRDHVARFPRGVTERNALAKLEDLVWAGLGPEPDIADLRDFLDEFPKGTNIDAARTRLARLEKEASEAQAMAERQRQETEAWAAASSGDRQAVEAFLAAWPGGQHAKVAQARLKELTKPKARAAQLTSAQIVALAAEYKRSNKGWRSNNAPEGFVKMVRNHEGGWGLSEWAIRDAWKQEEIPRRI